jgi:hypothetical protein
MRVYSMAECPQGSPYWHALHRGRPTASDFDRICTPARMEFSAQAEKYAAFLAAQCVEGGHSPSWFSDMRTKPPNQWIEHGKEVEPEARRTLSYELDCPIAEVGFCAMDSGIFGCSPDGLIEGVTPDGEVRYEKVIELKCPRPDTHAMYLIRGELPIQYMPQCHGQLIVTGLSEGVFCSFSRGQRPLIVPFCRNDFTVALAKCLLRFAKLYDSVLRKLVGFGLAEVVARFHSTKEESNGFDRETH